VLHFCVNAFLGNAHGADADTRSEGTDIDEPLSPSAREVGFSFSKNTSSSLSALAQSPPECLSPSKEEALKDELSPVTEVPSDIRKLKFNIGASPSDFILEENECKDVQRSSLMKDSQEFFKPISESGESDEQETVVERSKPTIAVACETLGQSLQSTGLDVKHTGVLHGPHDAGDSSDEERDFVDDGSGLDRMTLLSFDNIAYEDPVVDSNVQAADETSKQVLLTVSDEESAHKHHRHHKVSIFSDSDSEKLIDAEMIDIQSTLQTQFENTPASKLAGSLEVDQLDKMQLVTLTSEEEEEEYKFDLVPVEPHESIQGTHDAEVLNSIEKRRSNNFASGVSPLNLFGSSPESTLMVGDTETANVTDTLLVSAAPDDVMKTSTSSDASAEPMILAATYDLDLGAVSRVVATYDMSPDSVDKVFVIEKRSKVIQSSPDDEVFETEGGVKGASKTEGSSDIAESTQAGENLDFDTNEMPYELVKADDVDGYEAYLEVMQQNRAVDDQELGALLDLHVGEAHAVGEMTCDMTVKSALYTSDSVQQNVSASSTTFVQPDLIQGMPLSIDVDVLSNRSVHSFSEVKEDQSMVNSELVTFYGNEPDNGDNVDSEIIQVSQHIENPEECGLLWDTFNQLGCEDSVCGNTKHMPASFGKGALESDNMYQVFQQVTSNSPGDDDMLASSEDDFFGLQEKQTDDAANEYELKLKLEVGEDEDRDDDFLAESAEPELMVLSDEKEDEEEECNMQMNLLDYSKDCPAAATDSGDSLLVLDPQCLDRPLSPLPDSAYQIVDDTDDAYVASCVLHRSTLDSETEADTSFKQLMLTEDSQHNQQAAVIVSQVMANAYAAAEGVEVENKHLQDLEVDEGFFQVEGIPDLVPKDWQSGTFNEEVDDVVEDVQEDYHQSCEIYEDMQHHSEEPTLDRSETVSKIPDTDDLLESDNDYVRQKASEFVNYLVREAHAETEILANRSQGTGKSLTNYTVTDLCRVEEAVEEFGAESSLDHENLFGVVSSDVVLGEDTILLSDDQTEPCKLEAGFNGASFEWNGEEQTNFEDYGDSSSVDSFATVVPCQQEIAEDRMEDLASVSSSFHSDLHSSYLEDQPEPMLCVDARDEEFVHDGETEDSSGSEHFEGMRDDLDSSVVEMVPCYESLDGDKYGILDDDFDHPMMMLATIKEEDERSSISGKSGKSSSEKVDGTSDSDKHTSSGDLHAEYPCRRMVGKSADKDDVSVSSSLLEFESLEKEMQDRTSLDSLTKMGSQQSVAEKSSEASSSLLEFERIEKELQDRTSHDSLTKLGSLQSVAEKDNVSISSSLAEFERLETEIDVHKSAESISVHTTYGMIGSTTSLNAFLMDDLANRAEPATHVSQLPDESFAFHEQFESEAWAVVSMLEAGALPVMDDHVSVNKPIAVESCSADTEVIPTATDDVIVGSPIYPEYQDIVQIIRKASETAHENVEADSKPSHYRPAVHEPDVDSLNERDDDELSDEEVVMTAEARDAGHAKDMDNDSLQDDVDSQMYADQVVPFYERPDGTFPTEGVARADEDVMETSADSIEGIREAATLERSSDSLELRSAVAPDAEALMQQSVDSLSGEDPPGRRGDSFDADSLHESSALEVSDDCRQSTGLLMASVESGAWSQSDSLLSNTETLKSSGSSRCDEVELQGSSYCYSPASASSSGFLLHKENHAEHESGN